MNVILYTTHCPKCIILAKKLDAAGVQYETKEDPEEMLKLGFMSAPVLRVDNETYLFKEACLWADDYKIEQETK